MPYDASDIDGLVSNWSIDLPYKTNLPPVLCLRFKMEAREIRALGSMFNSSGLGLCSVYIPDERAQVQEEQQSLSYSVGRVRSRHWRELVCKPRTRGYM